MTGSSGSVIRIECPCRADLAGGTLDIWPLGMLHPGSVTVNAAIPVMVRMDVDLGAPDGEVWHAIGDADWTRLDASAATTDLSAAVAFAVRPTGGVRVRVHSQASLGSGLGGSSSYAVALARGILTALGEEMEDERLVLLARDLEARVLTVPTGLQDHWPAVQGGVLAIHHEPGGERVERLAVDPDWVGERLTVFRHRYHSPFGNGQLAGDPATARPGRSRPPEALEAIAEASRICRAELIAEDEDGVGNAIGAEWNAPQTSRSGGLPSGARGDYRRRPLRPAPRPSRHVVPAAAEACSCGIRRQPGGPSPPPWPRPHPEGASWQPRYRWSVVAFWAEIERADHTSLRCEAGRLVVKCSDQNSIPESSASGRP